MTDKLNRLRKQFEKLRTLDMEAIMHLLGTTSRMTVYRYLKQLDYLSSYSHNGKFYILRRMAKFDEIGLYHLGDIGFSLHGTLADTIAYIVEHSETGKTSSELAHQYGICVKNALLDLTKKKQITREPWKGRRFLYLSADDEKRQQQQYNRGKNERRILPSWMLLEVLVETIRASADIVHAHTVAERLLRRGSTICKEEVQQVFETYNLEKKTRDYEP